MNDSIVVPRPEGMSDSSYVQLKANISLGDQIAEAVLTVLREQLESQPRPIYVIDGIQLIIPILVKLVNEMIVEQIILDDELNPETKAAYLEKLVNKTLTNVQLSIHKTAEFHSSPSPDERPN